MRITSVCIFISTFFYYGSAQTTYGNEYLQIGVGARALAMSGSVHASVQDVNAAYWNPAALSRLDVPLQLGLMHSDWFGGVGKYDHIGIAKTFNKDQYRVGSISLIRLAIDQIPNTLNLIGPDGSIRLDNVTEFSTADYGVLLSYASAIGHVEENKSFRLGGTVKILRRVVGPFANAWGFGMDFGGLWIKNNLIIGIHVRDLTTTFTGWHYTFTQDQKILLQKTGNLLPVSTLEKTPPSVAGGLLMKINENHKLTIHPEIGFTAYFDGKRNTVISSKTISIEPKLGIEVGYNKLIFLRAGFGNVQKIKDEFNPLLYNTRGQLNAGLGIKIGKVNIDYALANVGNLAREINYSHVFSATLGFGK